MWQSLTEQIGIAIPVIMILLSLVLPVAAAFFYFRHIGPGMNWQKQLRERIHKLASLKGNSISHLHDLRKILVATEDTCLRPRIELLIEDSKELYEGKWLPEPSDRIQPEHLYYPGWQQIEKSAPAALLAITGTVISALLATAFWLYNPSLIADFELLRILIVLPIILGILLALILAKAISAVQLNTRRNWQELMLHLRRKFPVYSAEHETATLINGFLSYDRQMSESVAELTEQISHFSSQQLTDAITASVRSVMDKTVSGPVTASYEQMTILADNMNKQLETLHTQLKTQVDTNEQELHKLYRELMNSQQSLLEQMSEQLSTHHTQVQAETIRALENLKQEHSNSMLQLKQSQQQAWEQLDERQQQVYASSTDLLTNSIEEIAATHKSLLEQQKNYWQSAFAQLKAAEQQTLEILAERQKNGVSEMLDQTSSSIADALNLHIAPVAQRLSEAADVLNIAHEYADTIQETLKQQLQQSTNAQNKMAAAANDLSDRHQDFAADVNVLKTATSELTDISTNLNTVFTTSHADLLKTVDTFGSELSELSARMREVIDATAGQHEQIMTMNEQVSEVNQKQIDTVSKQIDHLSDELSTRVDQMLLGFSRMTEDMLTQIDTTVQNQNDTLGSSLRSLTNTMEEEARSMSLYSQQITMDITGLNESLQGAVGEFDQSIRDELSQVLDQLDSQVAEILSRLTYTAGELADAVDALPQALRSNK